MGRNTTKTQLCRKSYRGGCVCVCVCSTSTNVIHRKDLTSSNIIHQRTSYSTYDKQPLYQQQNSSNA